MTASIKRQLGGDAEVWNHLPAIVFEAHDRRWRLVAKSQAQGRAKRGRDTRPGRSAAAASCRIKTEHIVVGVE
ncbi:MAG: hypothetical protein ACRDQZ_20135, partial [Mycobacteriales bacterium]